MPDALFLDILALVVIAAILSVFAGSILLYLFFQKMADMDANAREELMDADPVDGVDEAFRTSPIGIPPSLARD